MVYRKVCAGRGPPYVSTAPRSSTTLASVIVPTYARPRSLARLLDSLAAQRMPDPASRFEIIVVDDGSPDAVRPREEGFPSGARLLRQENRGPAAARNRGAAEARGALLAFVDDDCTLEPDWLAALLLAHRAHPDALLGGATRNGLPDNLYSEVAESLLHFFDEEERRRGAPLSFLASNNIACGRAAFSRSGGFDASYPLAAGEDRAFCRHWLANVGALRRVPGARATHFHAHDGASFWRQQHNYGRGAALFHAAGTAEDPTDEVPPRARLRNVLPREPGFYARLLCHPLRRSEWSRRKRVLALPVVALSQLAVASGLRRERRDRAGTPIKSRADGWRVRPSRRARGARGRNSRRG